MKKLLLFASVIALMTSCAKTDITGDAPQAPAAAKGIYFAPSIADDAPASKANFDQPTGTNVFNTKWFSDKDRIGVIFAETGIGVALPGNQPVATAEATWFGKQGAAIANSLPFAFKASLSGVAGHFAAASDADVLTVKNNGTDAKSVIRAYWPLTDANKGQDLADKTTPTTGTGTKIALPALGAQKQVTVDGYGIVENSFMVAQTTFKTAGKDIANDNSITAERLPLTFHRISPVAWIKITSDKVVDNSIAVDAVYDRDYVVPNRFGNLKTVSLTAKGLKKTDGSFETTNPAPSKLTYNTDAKFDIAKTASSVEDLAKDGFEVGASGALSTITTTLGEPNIGLAWNNKATVFMSIANVNRQAFREKPETMETAVAFANMHFTKQFTTNKDWSVNLIPNSTGGQVAANWYRHPEIDIDAMPYIVYKYTPESGSVPAASSGYVLQINPSFTGDLATIFDGNNVKGFTTDGTTKIAKSDIKHIVAKAKLSDADLATVNSMTDLVYVTLLENTDLTKEKVFAGLTKVTYWNLPKVKTVANVNAFNSTTITDLYMGSFNFNLAENKPFRALTVANQLVRADVSATPEISTDYPLLGLNFQGFTVLDEIRVYPGVKLGVNAFKGCGSLKVVNFHQGVMGGAVVLAGNNVFENCVMLKEIAVSNKDIPAFSFKNCAMLATIKPAEGTEGGIVPEAIRTEAFSGCAFTDMNLSKAAIIEAGAFEECDKLVGNMDLPSGDKQPTLSVDAITVLNDKVFAGCTALKFVSFAKVTKIGIECFGNATTDLTEIRFYQPITVMGKTLTGTRLFGSDSPVATKLFINKDQKGIFGNTITLKGDATDSEDCATEFLKGIQVNPAIK